MADTSSLWVIVAVSLMALVFGFILKLPPMYLIGGALVTGLLLLGGLIQWRHLVISEEKRVALIGKEDNPFPIKTKLTVADAVASLEKGLEKRNEKDLLWTVIESDPEKGLFRAYTYTFQSAPRGHGGLDKYVYMNVKFQSVENDETEISWTHSFSPTVESLTTSDYLHPSTFATPTAGTKRVMRIGNNRVREIFGAEIFVED